MERMIRLGNRFINQFPIFEFLSRHNEREQFESLQFSPAFFSFLAELVDHGQGCLSGSVPFCPSMAQSHRGKRRFNGVCRPEMHPMSGRKVIECKQVVFILYQTFNCFRIFCSKGFDKQTECLECLLLGRCKILVMEHILGFSWRELGSLSKTLPDL